MTEARLSVVIDSRQAQRDTDAITVGLKELTGAGEKASQATTQLGTTIKSTNSETQKLTPSINAATKAIETQTRELKSQEAQVSKNAVGIREMVKYIGGFIAADRAIAAADGYTQMAARIRNATQSTEEYNLVQDRLLATANTTFRALSEAQEVYLSLSGGMKSLGYATKDTLDLSDSLSFAFTANATRADQAQSAMDALSKAMAKGKIDADAWISIVTGADNIIADMAKTTGRTEAEIRKLGAEGKASLEDLITTLIATREANEQLANNMENSFKDGLTKLTNEMTVFLGKLNDTTKATGTMAAGLGYLGENIENVARVGGVAASVYGGVLVSGFVKSATYAIAAQGAVGGLTLSMGTATAAARALYTALGGPVGLAIGIGGTIASMYLLRDSSNETTGALDTQIQAVATLADKYRELTLSKLISEQDELKKALKSSEAEANKAIAGIMGIVKVTEFSTQKQREQGEKLIEVATKVRDGALTTGKALIEMSNKGFTQEQISQAAAFFEKFDQSKKTYNEAGRALDYVLKQTGTYGDELEASQKKIADQQVIVNALSGDYKNLSGEMQRSIDWALESAKANGASAEQQQQVSKAIAEYNSKSLTAGQLAKVFRENLPIPDSELQGLTNLIIKTRDSKDKLEEANKQLKDVQANGPKAKQGFDEAAKGAEKASGQVEDLNKKLEDFNKTLANRAWDAKFLTTLVDKYKMPIEQAKLLLEAYRKNEEKGVIGVTLQQKELVKGVISQEKSLNNVLDQEKERTRELEKQNKLVKNLGNGLVSNSNLKGLPLKSGEAIAGGKIRGYTAEFAQIANEGLGNIKYFSSFNDSYHQDKGGKHPAGQAFDLALKPGTNSTAAVKQLYAFADAYGYVIKILDEYKTPSKNATGGHLHVSVTGRKKGTSDPGNMSLELKAQKDVYLETEKLDKQLAENRKRIELDAADEILKVRLNLAAKEEEIDKAGFSSSKASELKLQAQQRADIEIQVLEAAKQDKIASYSDYMKSEEQLLNESYARRQRDLKHDLDLTAEEYTELSLNLEKERKQELAWMKLAQEQRIFEAEQFMMGEIERFQRRYQLERDEIIKTTATDLEERKRRLNALNTETIRGGVGKNFSDPNDQGSQFLQSIQYSPVAKTNAQRLDEEFAEEQAKMLSNFEKVKELYAGNHEALLEAERQFLDAKQQLQDEYDFKVQDARKADLEHQLAVYSQMTSAVGSTFGQMMDIVSQVKEENSKTYKTFFAINKAIAFAQAIINTEEGATKALAQGGVMGPALAMAIRASGYASAGIIAAQAIAGPGAEGYATGGLITGPGTGTSDSIPIMASDKEFMIRAASVRKLGVDALNHINTYGELPKDTHRVGMGAMKAINSGADIQAERQAQANVKAQSSNPQPIENNVRVGIFDDRADMLNQMYGREGEKIVMYHLKRNGMAKP
ncbi:tape measure protein [Acinetobacter radioresistens]|uniref:tape measure protein n=1 Tax=Acinetobacter radioresistens TaxID=40216 RepID=UPI0021CDC812|nr:tape measure protein [Acinetobacter radioresistens]MCU4499260.1 tape measure protein [Acinetobacter radioresistens]